MGSRGTDEHRKLAQAIKDRDLAAARDVATTHLERTARRVRHEEQSDDSES
jgi:DNA-binding FadR family transcriptional regulator